MRSQNFSKYDNCYIPFDNITQENMYGRFQRMERAIAQYAEDTNTEPFFYSLCEWGWQQVWIWGKDMAQSWRITGDISKRQQTTRPTPRTTLT